MTRFPGSGLPKRIETPERYSSFAPEVGRVPEDVEQLLARLAIEARVVRQLLEHDHEARLLAGLVHDLGAFYMLYRAVQYRELRIRPETVKYILIEWHESIGETLLNALGLPEDIVSATIDHDRLLGLPSGLFSLKEVVYVSNMIAGAHPMWLKMPDDEISAFIIQVKEAYADFLPEIDASVKEMTEIFA